jgi:hypothetical protein
VVSGTGRIFGQITLSAGIWLVHYRPTPYNGQSGLGTISRAQYCISTTSGSLTSVPNTVVYDDNRSYTVGANAPILIYPSLTSVLTVPSTTTYYLNIALTFSAGAWGSTSNTLFYSLFTALKLA